MPKDPSSRCCGNIATSTLHSMQNEQVSQDLCNAIIFQSLLTQRVAFLLQVQWDGEEAASQRAKRVENLLIRMTLDGLPSTCIGNAIYRDWSRRPVLTVQKGQLNSANVSLKGLAVAHICSTLVIRATVVTGQQYIRGVFTLMPGAVIQP
ncbi:hypothetical protein EMCRGX_G014097 [Ephydatia muelleri]